MGLKLRELSITNQLASRSAVQISAPCFGGTRSSTSDDPQPLSISRSTTSPRSPTLQSIRWRMSPFPNRDNTTATTSSDPAASILTEKGLSKFSSNDLTPRDLSPASRDDAPAIAAVSVAVIHSIPRDSASRASEACVSSNPVVRAREPLQLTQEYARLTMFIVQRQHLDPDLCAPVHDILDILEQFVQLLLFSRRLLLNRAAETEADRCGSYKVDGEVLRRFPPSSTIQLLPNRLSRPRCSSSATTTVRSSILAPNGAQPRREFAEEREKAGERKRNVQHSETEDLHWQQHSRHSPPSRTDTVDLSFASEMNNGFKFSLHFRFSSKGRQSWSIRNTVR